MPSANTVKSLCAESETQSKSGCVLGLEKGLGLGWVDLIKIKL